MHTATALFILALTAGADGQDPGFARVGEVLWRGFPDALHFTPGARPFDLSPGGRSFVYLQGAPWPRVMFQPLPASPGGAAPEPVVLSTAPFFGERPPRFDHQGRNVFFTADLTGPPRKPPPQPPPGAGGEPQPAAGAVETVRFQVWRASTGGLAAERLLPAAGQSPGDFAVFLDVHPGGHTILVGTGRNLQATQLATGNYSLAASELTFSESGAPLVPARPLSFEVNGRALARYSWDGTEIYYGTGPVDGAPAPVFRYLRGNGLSEPTGLDQHRIGALAGDVEVRLVPVLHPGSFGWDGFPLCLLSRGPGGPSAPLEVSAALASPLPLLPVSVRGDRVLLAGGPEDRLEFAVARWDPAGFESALAGASRAPPPLAVGPAALVPPFWAGEARAGAEDPRAGELLREVRSALAPGPAAPLAAMRARWIERAGGGPAGWRLEATELVSGQIWVERTGGEEGKPAAREVVASNGKEAWTLDERGETTPLSAAELRQRVARASPLRLLADPAGVNGPGLSFAFLGEEKEGTAGRRIRLGLKAVDGYRAEVLLEDSGGQLLPSRIEAPLLFSREKVRRGLGPLKEKSSVSMDDWRLEGGRRIPGRIRFDDGLNPSELILEEVEINPAGAEGLFRQK